MPIAGTTTPLGHIRERRRKPHTQRTFERRFGGGATHKFEGMGAEKVPPISSQEESRAGGWGLKLALAAVAAGSIGGAVLFFAF